MSDEDTFYVGVKILVIDQKERILLLRSNLGNAEELYWDIPGGRIRRGENVLETLNRELYEETGLQLEGRDVEFVGVNLSSIRMPFGKGDAGLFFLIYRCEWNETPPIHLSSEHSDFWWAGPEEAVEVTQSSIPPNLILISSRDSPKSSVEIWEGNSAARKDYSRKIGSTFHLSVEPIYREVTECIQLQLRENGNPHRITQSIIELWKFIYRQLPFVAVAKVPGYPEYRREWVRLLIAAGNADSDWGLTNREDWEYFRIIEHFAIRASEQSGIGEEGSEIRLDLSDYNISKGDYWADL